METFTESRIPYKTVGELSFYDRAGENETFRLVIEKLYSRQVDYFKTIKRETYDKRTTSNRKKDNLLPQGENLTIMGELHISVRTLGQVACT